MSQFVHLHVHSEYSLLDGASRIDELAAQAGRLGMKALALTDHGVMYGAVPFYKACRAHGVKPIIGCEVYLTTGSMKDKGTRKENPIYHLILLATNEQGYRNLMTICSLAQLEGFHYKPRIDLENLAKYADGLIALSSCLAGEVSQHLLYDRKEEAKASALRYKEMFGSNFYLELQDHGLLEQKKVNQSMVELSHDTGIPLVATNDAHYVYGPDHKVQDILLCIGTGKTLDDTERLKFKSDQLYLKSDDEMSRLFPYAQEALQNTLKIAEQCNLELEFGLSILPEFQPIPEEYTTTGYLQHLCEEGLITRYSSLPEWSDPDFREKVEKRLTYELGVIGNMGFSDYFLIVWDFIRYAHEKRIKTGPGRGSSAGSLVAYVLRITDVDPIRYRLLFERFLNPERISMPDIDIDFSDERRDEVIEYVVHKYGANHVAQIITFGTMAAKAAVRDVGRVMNLPYNEVDRAAKLIPTQLGITIERALEINPELKKQCDQQPRIAQLIEYAMKVEGMPRHASTHAAGVVISREPLTHYVPLQAGSETTALTQYSMEHLEAIGLLKMDFLGLRTLSIIERAEFWIKEQNNIEIDFHAIPMDDPLTYHMLSQGDTSGIFQMESAGVRRVLKELKPSEFEDIVSVLALYRPGPMEFISKYIQGKHKQIEVDYPHPSLEPILADTYGIIVYQEQIMQIASQMAGFSLGEADLLRRAVSKKKREVLDEQRAHFVSGSVKQGFSEEEANKVYDLIVRFADYGFPRAHAAAYGILAFQTAYLKAHYPVQFMAAMLTAVMGNHRKVAEYIDECRRMKMVILPPDVNESFVLFTPVSRKQEQHVRGDSELVIVETADHSDVRDKTDRMDAGDRITRIDGISTMDEAESIEETDTTEDVHALNAIDALETMMKIEPVAVLEGLETTKESQSEDAIDGVQATSAAPAIQAIRFGLAAIKNVGTQAMETIIKERKDRPFADLLDFCRRVDLRVCNKRVIESLIQGGALDSLPGHRSQLIAMLDETLDAAVKWKKESEDLQLQLFGFVEAVNWSIEYPEIRPYTNLQQLELERDLLGLFISGHPMDSYDELLETFQPDRIHDLIELPDHREVFVAGMVVSSKTIVTKKGQTMAFMELEDRIAKVEVVLFPETFKRSGDLLDKGSLVLVRAKLQQQNEDVKLIADELIALSDEALPARLKTLRAAGAPARSASVRPRAGSAPAQEHAQPVAASQPPLGRTAQAPSRSARQAPGTPAQREPSAAASGKPTRAQRVFVRIAEDRETAEVLTRLKELLQLHSGPLQTVLFYDRDQKLLALTDKYNVKPSPELFDQIERIMGKDSVKVK